MSELNLNHSTKFEKDREMIEENRDQLIVQTARKVISELKIRDLEVKLRKGYKEMSVINLRICEEFQSLENEANGTGLGAACGNE